MDLRIKRSRYKNIFVHPIMGVTFSNWTRVLFKVRFVVHPAYIPKILFISMSSLIGVPMHIMEYLVYARRIKKQEVRQPVFILGHPRSGTTHLFNLLSRDPHLKYCTIYEAILPNTFLLGGKTLKGFIGRFMPDKRPQDNVRITINSPKEEEFAMANRTVTSYMFGFYFPRRARQFFEESVLFTRPSSKHYWQKHYDYFNKKLVFKHKGAQLLIKSPANTARIKAILELYPDAKFIHIHRNPLDVYKSTVGLYEKIIRETSFQKANEKEVKEYIISSYKDMYAQYLDQKKVLANSQLVEIAYEELIENPLPTLKRIYDIIELNDYELAKKGFEEELASTASYKRNKHAAISPKEEALITKEWNALYAQFEK